MAPKRIMQLDVLRALAIFLVLGAHFGVSPDDSPRLVWLGSRLWQRGGWIGVDLFFVLSGYLISGLLFKEYVRSGKIKLGRFFVRRGFKIYPPFYVLLICSVIYATLYGSGVTPGQVLGEALFVQNYTGGFLTYTWSLAVEEHFYIVLPLLLILLYRINAGRSNPFTALPKIFLAVAAVSFGLRVWTAARLPYTHQTNLHPTHLRIDSLFFGVLIGYYAHFQPHKLPQLAKRYRWLIAGLSIGGILPALVLQLETTRLIYTAGFTLLYLGFGGILVLALHWPFQTIPYSARIMRTLGYIGGYSYAIYLWHIPVLEWVIDPLRARGILPVSYTGAAVLYITGSVIMGIAVTRVVEFPMLRLRDRLFPSQSAMPIPANAAGAADRAGMPQSLPELSLESSARQVI